LFTTGYKRLAEGGYKLFDGGFVDWLMGCLQECCCCRCWVMLEIRGNTGSASLSTKTSREIKENVGTAQVWGQRL
jgi:hypothetical protein